MDMDLYEFLKTIHVVGAVIWVGGATAFQVLATRLARADDPDRLAAFGHDAEFVGMRVFFPASMVVLAAGIWMVADSGWNFSDLWIVLGLVGIAFSAIVGATFLGPESGRLATLIEERGAADPEVASRRNRIFMVSRIELAVLLLVVVNMVIKPGA
jgi:uncharacterized membrane protein